MDTAKDAGAPSSNGQSSNGLAAKRDTGLADRESAIVTDSSTAPTSSSAAPTSSSAAPTSSSASAAASGTPEAAAPQKSLEEISDDLLDLVSDRTGYPKEMLDWDLDLEADLGIDSIKRVEILGGLAESLGEAPDEDGEYEGQLELEKLTAIRTLRGIVDYLEETLFNEDAAKETAARAASTPTESPAGSNAADEAVQRGLVELVEAPMRSGAPLIPRGAVLVTDDGTGLASELIDRMTDFGQRVILIKDQPGGELQWEDDVCTADLNCPQSVAQLAAAAREKHNLLAGLVHAAPVATGDAVAARIRDSRTLYLLSRELLSDLASASQQGGAFVLACSSMDGCLGYGHEPLPSLAAACHGGVHGFGKCLTHELPNVLVRVVDFEPGGEPADRAEKLLAELGDADGPAEVGWSNGKRWTWAPVGQAIDQSRGEAGTLPSGAVVLVTGGARGITAAISAEIAGRCQPQLIIVGRSPLPEEESSETSGVASDELKAAIIDQWKREGKEFRPADVETRCQGLLRDREIRQNLESLREAGAEVEYHSVDVRDGEAVRQLVADVVQRKGRVDGVIHGAGVIEDKLIKDKTPESFDRVVSTKIDGALNVVEVIDPETLKFCVFFSSIAGRYGNKGQADYAVANEMLGKLAIDLNRRWPARVLAVDWGPWGGIGMVADLEKHLRARGVTLILPEVGAEFLVDELLYGAKEDSEVIIAGGAANLHSPSPATA